MPRPIRALIEPAAIENNLSRLKARAPRSRIWAVLKANAYGHGIARIVAALDQADGIAVLDLAEAVLLRELGWRAPILLLEGFFSPEDLEIVARLSLTATVHCDEQVRMLECAELKRPVDIQLKLNSGMNRLCFAVADYERQWRRARALPQVGSIVHMTHYSSADGAEGVATQFAVFERTCAHLPGARSTANSAATLWHPETHLDWIRPGILLYGGSPSGKFEDLAGQGFLPAMSLKSELISVRDIQPGDSVGYGGRFVASRPMRIGVVACGYADGYPRQARGWGEDAAPVCVGSTMTRLIGRVSMDMLAVDLTPCLESAVGTPVELWGRNVPIDAVACSADTIGYELMCALAARVPVSVAAVGEAKAPSGV